MRAIEIIQRASDRYPGDWIKFFATRLGQAAIKFHSLENSDRPFDAPCLGRGSDRGIRNTEKRGEGNERASRPPIRRMV